MNSLAPVIVFAYKRPDLLEQTLVSLSGNAESANTELFIFCDGPKAQAGPAERAAIDQVKKIASSRNWCGKTQVIAAESNKGLATSVMEGVSMLLNTHESVIVVEDDVRLSKYFLRFMNDALNMYASSDRVLAVGSWNYFADGKIADDSFFLRYPDSIAWATWKRSWSKFRSDGAKAMEELQAKNLMQRFNGDRSISYFSDMLKKQCEGKVDSWAIRWTATAILEDMYSIYPSRSLSRHEGFGEGATHETNDRDYNATLGLAQEPIALKPISVEENLKAFGYWKKFLLANFSDTNGFSGWKLWVWKRLPFSFRNWYRNKTVKAI
ncbi:MAG: hypothetical protein K1X56_01900 [Flavobacteriales bacterium]|nr:hypothetical protein [Flavobacteriales bacterium]